MFRTRLREAVRLVYRRINDKDDPALVKPKYFTVTWTHAELLPAHLLTGFQVVAFTGADPNDTSKYLLEPVRVGPAERSVLLPMQLEASTTVVTAVQALYVNGSQSSWRVLGGGVAVDPDTVAIATADLGNVPAGSVTGELIADGAVASEQLAPRAVTTQHLLQAPADNLVPNGYSEAGASALGLVPEGVGLVNEPPNAREGAWCRKRILSATTADNTLPFTGLIPCTPGDFFYAEFWAKASATLVSYGGSLVIQAVGADGSEVGLFFTDLNAPLTPGGPVSLLSTTYRLFTVRSGAMPAGTTHVRLRWDYRAAMAGGDVGKSLFFDAVSLRKSITADMIVANRVQSPDYAQDASGNATAGFKVDSEDPTGAIKVAGDGTGMRIGSRPLGDPLFRALDSIGRAAGNVRAWWHGNNNPSGTVAPNIGALGVQVGDQYVNSAQSWVVHNFHVQPFFLENNLDGLRFLDVRYYVGTAASAVRRGQRLIPIPDRKYQNLSTDADVVNQGRVSALFQYPLLFSGTTAASPHVYLLVALHNVRGVSAELWFLPPTGPDLNMAAQSASPFTGGPGAGGSTPNDPVDTCPAPEEPILLASGREVPAGALQVGDRVLTSHEHSLRLMPAAEVVHVSRHEDRWRFRLTLEDGREVVAERRHRFFADGLGFTELHRLRPGDWLLGAQPGRVLRVEPLDRGPVVKITVREAHTYCTRGLLTHNAKPRL